MSEHDRWADAAGAYLLGGLPDEEVAPYEAHLATCRECSADVEDLRMAADALPASAHPVAPPPALKARIMAEVEREAALLRAAGPAADRPARPRRRRVRLALPFALPARALAFAAAALLVGVVAGWVLRGGGESARTIAAQVDRARAPRAAAELDVRDGAATLVAHRLPAPPGGRVYQIWLQRPGGAPEPTAALFTPRRDGSATATVPGKLHGVQRVLVSAEPPGGSQAPTTQPILVAALS